MSFDGLLNLNKPLGLTSAGALYRVRRLTGIRKSGHAGTLDPTASGVLLICFGQGTRRVEQLMNLPKTYHASGRLDVTSRTLDAGSALEPVPIERVPSAVDVNQAIQRLVGRIEQVPPQVSALKVKGVPAYKRVRRGEQVTLQPRPVQVYDLRVQRFCWPEIDFEVCCGRGMYVRALIRDLGASLGAGGCLTALTRTAVGPFALADAATLEELQTGTFERRRIPLEDLDDLLKGLRGREAAG